MTPTRRQPRRTPARTIYPKLDVCSPVPVAFFTYPVMQVANILMPRAHLVPVGEDQLPHVELTREVARRFNRQFKEVFPEPEGLMG
jgi:tryptophanyl-tRNA synthetase